MMQEQLISCNNTFGGMFMIFHGSSKYAHPPDTLTKEFLKTTPSILRPFNVMAIEIQILLEFPVPFLEKEGERWGGYTS